MARSLANGHTKFTILTTEPANPKAPTLTELQAGIDASKSISSQDFAWSATASDTVNDPSLADATNSDVPTNENFDGSITVFRYYGTDAATEDAAYLAVKAKGTDLWCYARMTDKMATDAWAADDEIYLGGHVLTDTPQFQSGNAGGGGGGSEGYIKATVPLLFQTGYPDIKVGAGV